MRSDTMINGISGVILSGGENRRFPILKGFIEVEESTIIERNTTLLKSLFDEVLVSTNMPEKYFFLGVPLIGDVLPSRGPASGIYSALLNSRNESIFVLACDMPFASPDLISFLCRRHLDALEQGQVDATVPLFGGKPQPLFAVYSKTILPSLEGAVRQDKVTLRRLFQEIKMQYIGEDEVRAIDADGRSFVNINTVEDYEQTFRGAGLHQYK